MTIAIIASAGSIHTIRWANGLVEAGLDVILLTQHRTIETPDSKVKLITLPFKGAKGYILNVIALRSVLRRYAVDIVHSHFAFGYATLARLAGIRPLVVTVMGSDVDELPERNVVFKSLIRRNLKSADRVIVSSQHLRDKVSTLVNDSLEPMICQYGVSSTLFKPNIIPDKGNVQFIFGTVKMLEHVYGIDRLIYAFQRFLSLLAESERNMYVLRIVGSGSLSESYKFMVHRLGLNEQVQFVSAVRHDDVPSELAKMDVFMALSRREGFGVAIAEAGMMGLPVIASNVGGIPDIIENCYSGFLVDGDQIDLVVARMREYSNHKELRNMHGQALRKAMLENYEWDDCVKKMINIYGSLVDLG